MVLLEIKGVLLHYAAYPSCNVFTLENIAKEKLLWLQKRKPTDKESSYGDRSIDGNFHEYVAGHWSVVVVATPPPLHKACVIMSGYPRNDSFTWWHVPKDCTSHQLPLDGVNQQSSIPFTLHACRRGRTQWKRNIMGHNWTWASCTLQL